MNELPLWAIGIIGTIIFFTLMFLRMHVGLSLMIAGFVGIWLSRGLPATLNTLATTVWRVSNSTYLVVIPLFVLMGIIAGRLGVTKSAFNTFNSWVGHLRGGLAMTTIWTCAAFGAVCGDNIATAMTMDKAALPEMRKYGYDDSLVFGSIAAGGNLGILIPPSTAFVVFGFITETSIAGLFIAGILPGILLTLILCSQIAIQCKINPGLSSKAPKAGWKERLISLRGLIGIVVVFGLVMGGLLGGLFTPTEAGAAGTLAVIIVGLFYKQGSLADFFKTLGSSSIEATKVSAMILLLIFGAQFFSHFLTTSEIAPAISNTLIDAELSKYIVMILLAILYIALGAVMDIWSIMIITLPIFFPVLTEMGFDPLQLGVIAVLCIMIGCITPPVGVVVFSLAGLHPEVPMYKIFRGCWPFVATMFACLLLLIFLPALSTALPNLMY
jgi:tripartite ATP-independent transporter DctM subunit